MLLQLIITWTLVNTIASQCDFSYISTSKSLEYTCGNVTSDNYLYYMDRLNPQIQKVVGSANALDITINFITSTFNEVDNWITSPMTTQYNFWINSKIFFNFSDCGITSIKQNAFDFSVSSFLYPALDLSFNNIKNVDFLRNNPKLQYLYLKNATNSFTIFDKIFTQNPCQSHLLYIDLSYTSIDAVRMRDYYCFPTLNLSYSRVYLVSGPSGRALNVNLSKCELIQFLLSSTQSSYITFTDLDLSNIDKFDITILKTTYVLNTFNLARTNIGKLDKDVFALSNVLSTNLKLLDMSNTNLQSISKEYFSEVKVEVLNLSENNVAVLEEEVFSSANIKQIDLSNSEISEIKSGCFRKLTSDKLLLSNNKISNMESPFPNATIKELILSHNNISTLENVFSFTQVTTLDLSFNPIQTIDNNTFANCLNLKNLNLANTYIPKIADYTFKSLSTLESLEISLLGNFESEIFESLYLKSLIISNSNISSLQNGNFKGLYYLEELKFENTVINNVANDALKYLIHVKSLDSNVILKHLKIIPKGFFNDLLSLTSLDLSDIQFDGFEAGAFDGLINLNEINITGSSLENDFTFISKFMKLEGL